MGGFYRKDGGAGKLLAKKRKERWHPFFSGGRDQKGFHGEDALTCADGTFPMA